MGLFSKFGYAAFVFPFSLILGLSCGQYFKNQDSILGVVSSATPESSKAGTEILNMGGNSIDAAVAVSFALAVTETPMSGLGGGSQVLLSLKNQPPVSINGTTLSPALTPRDMADTLSYHRRSTIPSTVKVLDYIWKKYGSGKISWENLLAPAIKLAEEGYRPGPFRAKVYQRYKDQLRTSPHNIHFFLLPEGEIPEESDLIVQKTLGQTLRRLAKFGADDFYHGKIAEQIHEDMQRNNGWITIDDLNNFPDPVELQPLKTDVNRSRIYTQPPPCGGWVSLLAHNLLAKVISEKISDEALIQTLFLAHQDRENNPVNELENYQDEVNLKLSDDYATALSRLIPASRQRIDENSGETTHFSVVDSEGNVVAVTASINAYFGAMAASPELGFLYNTYMDDFIFQDSLHPFAIRPDAMAYSSMTPTIVQQDERNVLVLGSPGSSRIISSVFQVTAKWIENGDIELRVSEPRLHVSGHNVYVEKKSDSLKIELSLMNNYGLKFKFPKEDLIINDELNAYYGGIHAIAFENGVWKGIADPRRDGAVAIATK